MPKLTAHIGDTRGILNKDLLGVDITPEEALVFHAVIARLDASDAKPNDSVFEVDENLNASIKLFGFKIPIQDGVEFSLSVTE